MIFTPTSLEGAWVIEPQWHEDERGAFSRLYCEKEFSAHNIESIPRQMNHSINRLKGTLRGLHFQYPPFVEAKCVKCIKGAVFDVIVDIRKGSKTFLQTFSVELNDQNNKMLYIPPGFAHGFQTLQDDSQLLYLHSEFYRPAAEGGLRFDDPVLRIDWPTKITSISERDMQHPSINQEFEGITL